MLAIRLRATLEKRLAKLAKRTGRTKTFYVRQAIEEQLADLEDIYLAEAASVRIECAGGKTIPLEEILKRYGLDDSL